ncbi:hypothetical protein F2Q69_00054499 [Brassica cretica]|uniref:Uncharacterized protein n=1 Tax=Brassica cretica TaxID=69181 RepID=A0A8S9N2E2_BRACR|nr:hypothetical protein F2Q69_00054499 [Brassica cretica]
MYPNQPKPSSSMAIGPWTSQARVWQSDHGQAKLSRYAATKRLGRYVATELEPSLVAT